MRALLLLASHMAHRGHSHDAAVAMASAVELFQTAALVHDDVIDDSDTRRGAPAAHRRLAGVHSHAGWLGDSGAFGTGGAILAGDLALMASHRAAFEAVSLSGHAGATVMALYTDMAELVTAGQYADIVAAAQPLSTLAGQEQEILAVMRSKTASYSAEGPLALGAAIAGADAGQIARMRRAGVTIGLAFQVRDDVLGLTGVPDVTGKPVGDDLREGKRTLVLWRAWTTGSADQRGAIASVLGRHDAGESETGAAIRAIEDSGALDWAHQRAVTLTHEALEDLGDDLAADGDVLLRDLIDRVVSRVS